MSLRAYLAAGALLLLGAIATANDPCDRLDLDEYEGSKERLKEWEAETAAAAEESETRAESARVSGTRGPRPAPDSVRAMSRATGVPAKTIHDTRRHVEAAEEYPLLRDEAAQDGGRHA